MLATVLVRSNNQLRRGRRCFLRTTSHAQAKGKAPPHHVAAVYARCSRVLRLPSHRGSFLQPGGAHSPQIPPIHWPRWVTRAPIPTVTLIKAALARTTLTQNTGSLRKGEGVGIVFDADSMGLMSLARIVEARWHSCDGTCSVPTLR